MTIHEIKPKQLRALLLLLVLVPFIPMALMLRFMADALEGERDAARERTFSTYQRTLFSGVSSLEKHLAARTAPPQPEEIRSFCRDLFDSEVDIGVTDSTGRILAGPSPAVGQLVAQTSVKHLDPPWGIQLYLLNDSELNETVRAQFKVYSWTALITAVAICAIAAAAGLTVSQQLRLHELKNTSVATVAHELRTPLANMRMLVDTLHEGRYKNEEQLREYLNLISAENLRLSRLTDHFLTHSRLARGQQSFTFAQVPPGAVIEQAVAALRAKLEAPGCHFTLDVAEPLPEIVADRDSLVTVLINLLENALKYTDAERHIKLEARATASDVVLAVSDNGVGLSRSERRRVFEPFYQADQKLSRTREGCGLGLSIVREIVEAHRGSVDVESQPGKGSKFVITLPLRNETA